MTSSLLILNYLNELKTFLCEDLEQHDLLYPTPTLAPRCISLASSVHPYTYSTFLIIPTDGVCLLLKKGRAALPLLHQILSHLPSETFPLCNYIFLHQFTLLYFIIYFNIETLFSLNIYTYISYIYI